MSIKSFILPVAVIAAFSFASCDSKTAETTETADSTEVVEETPAVDTTTVDTAKVDTAAAAH